MYLVSHFRAHDNERSLALQWVHSATASTLTLERRPSLTWRATTTMADSGLARENVQHQRR